MPSLFENLVSSELGTLYAVYGLAATYTAPDGTVTSGLTVRVHRNESQKDGDGRVAGEIRSGELMVQQSALAKPVRGGRFLVEETEAWTIDTTPLLQNGQFVCACIRSGVERLMERRAKD